MNRIRTSVLMSILLLISTVRGEPVKPWPAEAWQSAQILTSLDPDFKNNMSGASYNPETDTYWVCRNGGPSAFWALTRDAQGTLQIDRTYALKKGDLEGICQVDYQTPRVYLMLEGSDKIRAYDVAAPGPARLRNEWDISGHVPTRGSAGSEGLTFVPDEWLRQGRFTDAEGTPYTSRNGMGGLMFVAHQNGGGIYVFDLSPDESTVSFVGAYRTSRAESSGLEFDRSTGRLYIWHNTGPNYLEVTRLASRPVGAERQLVPLIEYAGPRGGNLEGIALTPAGGKKNECLIVDDDNQDGAAVMWFRQFNAEHALPTIPAKP